jgi:hypothetical protein
MPDGCVRSHRAESDWRRSERFRCLSASRSACRCLWPLSLGLSLIKTGHDVGAWGFRSQDLPGRSGSMKIEMSTTVTCSTAASLRTPPLGRREVHLGAEAHMPRSTMSAAALPVVSRDLPDAAHSLLEAVKALVAFLVAEFRQG